MAILIRVTNPDGSDPIALPNTTARRLSETINSADEGISFQVAKSEVKADALNPRTGGYSRFWEAWDTETNERLNYGPITSIQEKETDWSVTGSGRSALLNDYISSRKVFFARLDTLVDSLRYENIAEQPHSSTLIHDAKNTALQTTIFGAVDIDEKYYGLSQQTKDNVIDSVVRIPASQAERPNTYYTVDSFWSGMSKNDAIIVDLGDEYNIDKLFIDLPWWGGKARHADRTYDYSVAYASSTGTSMVSLNNRTFGEFTEIFNNHADIRRTGGLEYYFTPAQEMRYIRVNIANVHAWYGSAFDNNPSIDGWTHQCDPAYVVGSFDGVGANAKGIMTEPISDRILKPENDCHASVLEVMASKKFLNSDLILPLALQRIDNNNLQISYSHTPDPAEIITTDNGMRKFEPGGFFRRYNVTWTGADSTYTKFFPTDCSNCYPDAFNFGVLDQDNTLIFASDSASGTNLRKDAHISTRSLLMKGSSTATIDWVDSWQSEADPLSWGASYSYSSIEGDYATIHFRGQSFKWYATIPTSKVGATVRIQIRSKTVSTWSSWTILEDDYVLPSGISSAVVYEISYESGLLNSDTTYEIRIINKDGAFCSIDSIEGYWSAAMNSYNEDARNWFLAKPEVVTQIYDKRYSEGSMYKWNKKNWMGTAFTGDRIILLSYKGRHHGKLKLYMEYASGTPHYDANLSNRVFIPGGDPIDGSLEINLDTGKRGEEIPGYIMFDTNDFFPNGLPWGRYRMEWHLATLIPFNAYPSDINKVWQPRCEYCKDTGDPIHTNKWVYFDGGLVHETVGISVTFDNQTHLEQITSLAEAVQVEWGVTEQGIRFEPRIGRDTEIILREGQDTVVEIDIVNDVSKVASILVSEGADIDGLPLSTIVEDKANKEILGRTVMRKQDFRSMGDYHQLIGLSRTELKKRKAPEKRITVTHSSRKLNLRKGDSFVLYTRKMGPLRVRVIHSEISESSNAGRVYTMECIEWPVIK